MKNFTKSICLSVFFLMLLSNISWGQLLTEDFNYTAGDTLGSHGFTSHSGGPTNPISITAPGLTYSGFIGSGIGNAVTMNTSGEDYNKAFTSQNSGSLYFAIMVNITAANTTGDYFAHFGATSGTTVTSFGGRFWAKRDASNNIAFGISKSSTAANISYTGFSYALNTTYLIVVKYNFVAGATNDNADLFINPVINGTEPSPTISTLAIDNATADPTQLTSFCLRQGSASNAPTPRVDGIRVGIAWNDVVPSSATPTIVLSSPSQVGNSNVGQGSTSIILSAFQAAVTVANASLSSITFTSAGSYVAADLTRFKLWYNGTENTFGTATPIGTEITTSLGSGTHTFSGFTQAINNGSTGYFWITCDISGAAGVGNTINAAADPVLTFASGTPTGSISIGGTKTIIEAIPDIILGSSHPVAGNINQNSTNNILYSISVFVDKANATLTDITVTTGGNYLTSDLQANGFKFWLNSANNLTGATQIGTNQAIVTSGGDISVSGLSQIISVGTQYILVTADVAYNANTSHNISITSTPISNIIFYSGNISGTIDAGNAQTFTLVTPSIAISGLGPNAANIYLPSTNSILYQLSFAVTNNSSDFTDITLTTGGTYQLTDLVAGSFKLWYNTTNTFSTATVIGSGSVPVSGSGITFSGLNKFISVGTTGYIWLTADAASGAVVGRTIEITSTAFSNIIFSAGSKTGTDPVPAGGLQTFSSVPTLTEVILPQFMQGFNGTNNSRLPYVYLVTLNNLSPNATYRYFNQVVISSDLSTVNGAGNVIFRNTSGDFTRTSGPSLATASNYSEFITDGNGSYTGWFISEPTGNAKFTPGTTVYMRIMLNDGAGGTIVTTRLTTTNGVTVLNFGATLSDATGFKGTSTATAKNFVLLYDNVDGTGRPISGTFIESDGSSGGTTYPLFYQSPGIDGVAGAFGTLVPNNLPNGIRRVEQRALQITTSLDASSEIIGSETSSDGIWGSVNTVNPNGGLTTPLAINFGALPVKLATFNSSINARNIKLNWITESENNNSGFEIERAVVGSQNSEFRKLGFINGNGTKNTPTNYSFEDKNLQTGKYKYRLKQIDVNGNFEYFNLNGEIEIGVPKKYDLSQNYPNPFNPVTKINFDLPKDTKVELRVYDMLGREVSTLVNEVRKAGYYTVDFNASQFSSGVYFYRLVSGDFSMVKKLVILK